MHEQYLIESARQRKFMDEHKEKNPQNQPYDLKRRATNEQIRKDQKEQRRKRHLVGTRGSGDSCSVPLKCVIIVVFMILIIILFIYLMSPCDMNNGNPIMFAQKKNQTCDC